MREVKLESVGAGHLVFDQGDPSDRIYIVCKGRIRTLLKDAAATEVNLAVLRAGDLFGEAALVSERTRETAAWAIEESVLLPIERTTFERRLLASPEHREAFEKFVRATSIRRFLNSCADISALSPKELRDVVNRFQEESYKKGDIIFRQGDEGDNFYLIERGRVEVVRWEDGQSKIINVLREGNLFGEKALIERTVRFADIVCSTDCHVFSLSKDAFDGLLEMSPRLRDALEDRIASYRMTRPASPSEDPPRRKLVAQVDVQGQEGARGQEATTPRPAKVRPRRLSSFYRQRLRFPFIMQHDEMTCGTTCLMIIAKYYGKTFSSARLRELAHVDLGGVSMANLASAAEQIGFATRGMRLDYEALKSVPHPCIVHWGGYHFVVVYKMDGKHVWVSDPSLGLRKYDKESFCENWNGVTLLVEPTPEFEGQAEDRSSLRNFVQFVRPYKTILFEVFLASMLLNVFGLATPIFTQNVIDKVVAHHNVSMLKMMFIGMLLVLVFRLAVGILRQYLIVHMSLKVDLRMLVAFYKHMLALPLGYFKVRRIGDFIARFGENRKIRNFLTNTALTLVLDTVLIVVYVSLMFYYNVEMAGATLAFVPVFIAITLGFTPVLKRLNVDSFAANAEAKSHLIESINAIDTVKALNIEYPTRWKWEEKFIKSLNIDRKLYSTAIYFNSFGEFVGALSSTVILCYGAHKVIQGAMSVGELMAFMALMGSVIAPVNRIIAAWDDIQQTLVSVDRLNDVFTAKPEFPESMKQSAGIVIQEPRGEIVFENVSFRYGGQDDPYVISDVDLRIAAGQTVAIVGRSGSGKSTLVKLIVRFYDVTEGRILVDGYDVRNLGLGHLRRLVGFVVQESFIFNGTVRENIALGDPDHTMAQVVRAAKLANAHDFISNLAQAYETKVGESGLQLSSGQKQRIAIARVLYANPKVIVLDEATAALDTESEQAIQKNMKAILADKTAIIIAHRLSTVRNADNIVVLDDGKIVEQGTHERLMARRGLYHYLNHQQLDL